jgi:hypothetical protein
MKTLFGCFLAIIATTALAQEESEYLPEPPPAVVYEAPVIYHAPVLYQAPVIYYAPVYYITALAVPEEISPPPCPAPSTVFNIGGRGGSYAYANCGLNGSTVMHFGGAQGCAYGYQFNRPR